MLKWHPRMGYVAGVIGQEYARSLSRKYTISIPSGYEDPYHDLRKISQFRGIGLHRETLCLLDDTRRHHLIKTLYACLPSPAGHYWDTSITCYIKFTY